MHKYQRIIYWSDNDQCFIAYIPELKGCMAHGDTPEEAVKNINIALELWVETALEEGWELPKPKGRLEVAL